MNHPIPVVRATTEPHAGRAQEGSAPALATQLLQSFFITDEKSLVGRLTKLPAEGNAQAVCQWLLQLWPWLAYRSPTESELRRILTDFANTVRFIFL